MRNNETIMAIAVCLVMLVSAGAFADDKTGEQIDWYVIGGGGGTMSSANYSLSGTIGQTAVGSISSANYSINQGYWQSFSGSSVGCTLRGDANCNGTVNIADMTYMVSYLFNGGVPPCLMTHGDVNCDDNINITDMTYMVNYLFGGGPAPCPC